MEIGEPSAGTAGADEARAKASRDPRYLVSIRFEDELGERLSIDGVVYDLKLADGSTRTGVATPTGIMEWNAPAGASQLKLDLSPTVVESKPYNRGKWAAAPKANIIGPIPWLDLHQQKPITSIKTGVLNVVKIKRETIPIIFIPGIMGSRLRVRGKGDSAALHLPWSLPADYLGGNKAWDPDDLVTLGWKFRKMSAAERKALLVGSVFMPTYLVPDYDNKSRAREQAQRGWGGLMWGSMVTDGYGDILQALEGQNWQIPTGLFFRLPVYAYAYNWTASIAHTGGELLVKYIDEVIRRHSAEGCQKVVLVTHSMGGLLARSAAQKAESKILGIVHGVQPARGAASGYWRMKAGMEPGGVTPLILGKDGQMITAVMGNIPGALQLLPSPHYTANNRSHQWLVLHDGNSGRVLRQLPKDPSKVYEEIYLNENDSDPARLISNKLDLVPGSIEQPISLERAQMKAWVKFQKLINDRVKPFHKKLGLYQHPETHAFYGTEAVTADQIEFKIFDILGTKPGTSENTRRAFELNALRESGPHVETGRYWEVDQAENGGRWFQAILQPPTGSGDGTVAESSGAALEVKGESHASPIPLRTKGRRPYGVYPGLDHQSAFSAAKFWQAKFWAQRFGDRYDTPTEFTVRAIKMLCALKAKRGGK